MVETEYLVRQNARKQLQIQIIICNSLLRIFLYNLRLLGVAYRIGSLFCLGGHETRGMEIRIFQYMYIVMTKSGRVDSDREHPEIQAQGQNICVFMLRRIILLS